MTVYLKICQICLVEKFESVCNQAKNCMVCKEELPFHPKPVFAVHPKSKILIVGQAPGTRVQETGIPWNDPSGRELRRWLDVTEEEFYNEQVFGIMPMGFCYPGKGKQGDLPPRVECAPLWHPKLIHHLKELELVLLIGQYAQAYYLAKARKENLTNTVKAFQEYLPYYFPLVHPSPRNRLWQKKNPWFEEKVIPELQYRVKKILGSSVDEVL